jgi:hypothetical protein
MTADTTFNLRGPAPLKEQLTLLAHAADVTLSKYIIDVLDAHVVSVGGRSSRPGTPRPAKISDRFVIEQVLDDLVLTYHQYIERGVGDAVARKHLDADVAGYAARGLTLSVDDLRVVAERIS